MQTRTPAIALTLLLAAGCTARTVETAAEEVDATVPVVTRIMEEATLPAISLKVPLKVDARAADNWEAAH